MMTELKPRFLSSQDLRPYVETHSFLFIKFSVKYVLLLHEWGKHRK